MSAQKLKSLKVADLRAILSKASAPAPARATKADLVTRILASEQALQAFHSLYPSDNPVTQQESSTTVSTATQSPVATPSVAPQPLQPAPTAESATTESEADKRKQRAERFGIPVASPSPSKTHSVDPELEKRKKRAERFGIPLVEPKPKQSNDADKLKTRGARLGMAGQKRAAPGDTVDTDEQERRKKRGERFGLVM